MFPVIRGKSKHAVRAVPSPPHTRPGGADMKTHVGQAQVRLHKYTVQQQGRESDVRTDPCMAQAKGEFYKDERKLRSKTTCP